MSFDSDFLVFGCHGNDSKERILSFDRLKVSVAQELISIGLLRWQTHNHDHVQNYASQVLEQGLVFKNFLEPIKVPNRARMIHTLKVMIVLFKAYNWLSKYADEILQYLVHQLAILSEHDAHMMFYSMFVNKKGRIDTDIPCDLQMEYIVCVCKICLFVGLV